MFKKRVQRPKTPPNLVPDDRFSIPEIDDPDEDYDERITGYSTKRWRWFTPDKNVKLMRLPDMTEKMSLTEKREEPVYHTVFLSKPVMWADSGEMNFSKRPLPTARRGWELDKAKQFTLEEMRRANDEQAELVTKGGTDLYIPRPIQPAKEQAKIPRERFLGTGFAEDKLDYRRIAPTGEKLLPGEMVYRPAAAASMEALVNNNHDNEALDSDSEEEDIVEVQDNIDNEVMDSTSEEEDAAGNENYFLGHGSTIKKPYQEILVEEESMM